MLVLSRKCNESIVIPSIGVTITVLGQDGRRVMIGVDAPEGVAVHRKEVWERIRADEETSR